MKTTKNAWMTKGIAMLALGLALGAGGCLEPESTIDEGDDTEMLTLACGAEDLHAYTHDLCHAMDAEGDGECFCALGFAWDGEACVMLAGCECTGLDCDSLAQTEEECLATHAVCGAGSGAPADEPEEDPADEPADETFSCGSEALFAFDHESCEAMDAEGDNACWCSLGYAWDGIECVHVAGCECTGADCDSLYRDIEACRAAHASCG